MPKVRENLKQSKVGLKEQKEIVSKIMQDQNFMLSMEYLQSTNIDKEVYEVLKTEFFGQKKRSNTQIGFYNSITLGTSPDKKQKYCSNKFSKVKGLKPLD